MPDFTDDVTVSSGSAELIRLGVNTGEHDNVAGGRILIRDASGTAVLSLSGGDPLGVGQVFVTGGSFSVWAHDGTLRVAVHGGDELLNEEGGTVELRHPGDAAGDGAVRLSAHDRALTIANAAGKPVARLSNSAKGIGELRLCDSEGRDIAVLGPSARLELGGPAGGGDVLMRSSKQNQTIRLDGENGRISVLAKNRQLQLCQLVGANVILGGGDEQKPGWAGRQHLLNRTGRRTISLDGDEPEMLILHPQGKTLKNGKKLQNLVQISVQNDGGSIRLYPPVGNQEDENDWSINLDGHSGDIALRNADCAEDFAVSAPVTPGLVLVIGDDERLRPSSRPYDTRVAGVVSGAGGLRPGIVLGRDDKKGGRALIALSGRVFCRADATHYPIAIGDLLTTSSTDGHAMTVQDPGRAVGAILGKALGPLSEGRGLIPILVALQ